jgi:hypothetical protein
MRHFLPQEAPGIENVYMVTIAMILEEGIASAFCV